MKFFISLLFCLIFVAGSYKGYSQRGYHKNAVYVEAFGPGIVYSVNYDWRFKRQYRGHGMRVGLGALNYSDGFWAAIPVTYNFIFAREFRTNIELGAGLTFAYGDFNSIQYADTGVFGHLLFGIRYRPFNNSLFLKTALTPLIRDEKIRYIFGNVGFGFSF